MKENNSFFRVNKIEGNQFLSFDVDINTTYDKIACGALKLECPAFIIPAMFEKSSSILTIRYAVPEGFVSLEEFTGKLMIEDVLKLYGHVLNHLEACEDWYLRAESFCFETAYVFINEQHDQVMFAYIPNEVTHLNEQGFKAVLISLLEKCNETSGGTIQLQLYKYFYKPNFSIAEFKKLLLTFESIEENKPVVVQSTQNNKNVRNETQSVANLLEEEAELLSSPAIKPAKKEEVEIDKEPSVYGEKGSKGELVSNQLIEESKQTRREMIVEEVKAEDVNLRSIYTPQPNRSQLSQEEIEEMVKSIYSAKPLETNEKTSSSNNTYSAPSDRNSSPETEYAATTHEDTEDSFYGSKSKSIDNGNVGLKRKNLFDNVFNAPTPRSQPMTTNDQRKGPVLKSISTHTRYDLPKVIPVNFVDEIFIIGRGTRTGEATGAHYEFGAEITPISRIHAQIERQDEVYYLKDLGSSNGTFLNGMKIEANKPYQVEEGDKIAFAIAFSKSSIEYMFVE